MNRYRCIFELSVRHGYYADQRPRGLIIEPEAFTATWMRRSGMVFYQEDSRCYVLAHQQPDLEEVARETPDLVLTFDVKSQDAQFVYFTDYPLQQLGRYVFSNETAARSADGTWELNRIFVGTTGMAAAPALINIRLSAAAGVSAPQYVARFGARATRWKYFIINQTDKKFERLRLSGSQESLFTGPIASELQTGTPAILFDSGEHQIPLQAGAGPELSLLGAMGNGGTSTDTVLIDRLPGAQPRHLQLQSDEQAGGKAVFSAIYVYL